MNNETGTKETGLDTVEKDRGGKSELFDLNDREHKGHGDLTVHKTDIWWNMLIKFSKQIGNSFARKINTKVNSKPCQTT